MEIIVTMVVFVVLFLIFRALILWYWRINEMADTLHEINRNIAKLANGQESNSTANSSAINMEQPAVVSTEQST